jgi:acyl phosphate:glycerol-3-phosphate acyltransferase
MFSAIVLCILSYLLGSLSSAVILCRLAGVPDPRLAGSKNPGATNVLRLGGKTLAFLTLLCDVLKGALPVFVGRVFFVDSITMGFMMLAVVVGHMYPIFHGFKGGKGVATAAGAILALSWPAGVLLVLTWILMAFMFKISSLAALIAAILAPFYVGYTVGSHQGLVLAGFVLLISVLIIIKHRANIQRLMRGEEPKIGS